jgi:hypothetical protein
MSNQKLTFDDTCNQLSKLGFSLGLEDIFQNKYYSNSRFQIWVHPTNHIIFTICEFGPNQINQCKLMSVWKLKPDTLCETFLGKLPRVALDIPYFWHITNPNDRSEGYLDNTMIQYTVNTSTDSPVPLFLYYKYILHNADFLIWDKQPALFLFPNDPSETSEYENAHYDTQEELRNSKNKENLMKCITKLSLDPKNFGL